MHFILAPPGRGVNRAARLPGFGWCPFFRASPLV